jgi:D-glycero-D-manno-heptose 1,7-bisphosphate phosphatase
VKRAVFLDRDGVLNATTVRENVSYPPATAAEVRILPGVAEALAKLKSMGFLLIVVTNQPDIARGTQSFEELKKINDVLTGALPLDSVRVCPHDNADQCACRKPKAGMILDAAREFGIDLAGSFMVGDRWSDVAAGAAAGCKTIFLERSYSDAGRCRPDFKARDLVEAADIIVNVGQSERR